MKAYEELLEIDAVGGTDDVLVSGDPQEGVTLSITDAEGNVVVTLMDEQDARRLQNMLLSAANAASQAQGGAA